MVEVNNDDQDHLSNFIRSLMMGNHLSKEVIDELPMKNISKQTAIQKV